MLKTDIRIVQEWREGLGSHQLYGGFKTVTRYDTDVDLALKGFTGYKGRREM